MTCPTSTAQEGLMQRDGPGKHVEPYWTWCFQVPTLKRQYIIFIIYQIQNQGAKLRNSHGHEGEDSQNILTWYGFRGPVFSNKHMLYERFTYYSSNDDQRYSNSNIITILATFLGVNYLISGFDSFPHILCITYDVYVLCPCFTSNVYITYIYIYIYI